MPESQAVAIGLAISESVIHEDGAYRVHGGGFAGTIQAFVNKNTTEAFIERMEKTFGKGCCYILRIRALTKGVAEAYYASREALGFPGCKK